MNTDIRACQPGELDRLIFLLDEEFVFGKGRTISLRQRFPTVYCGNNLHNLLLCTEGKEIASALAMRPFDWREGNEIFSGAMIGAVYTHPARRKEGLASRLLDETVKRLREEKVDFGVLWAEQQSFYTRLGWAASDYSVLGEIEPNELMPESFGDVSRLPVEACAPRLEGIRQSWLNAMTLRRPEDYCRLPLPTERVEVLWREDRQKTAYALLGSRGTTGFLYELVGDTACFPVLWREACRDRRRIFINDRAGSHSCRWLTDHAGITWQEKNLAMWLPLSKRVDMSRLEQWHIPYFDRI